MTFVFNDILSFHPFTNAQIHILLYLFPIIPFPTYQLPIIHCPLSNFLATFAMDGYSKGYGGGF